MRSWRKDGWRRWLLILALLAIWQTAAMLSRHARLILPDVPAVAVALAEAVASGEVGTRLLFSIRIVGLGLALGVALSFGLTALALTFRPASDLLDVASALFHPLPGVALLPLALLWLGAGEGAIVAIVVHSVVWPLTLNLDTGFRSVDTDLVDAGRVYGYDGLGLVCVVMLPCALPHILAGLRIAWARSWRALVAAEMVFGAAGGKGGLGWMIYQRRFFMDVAGVFAGLAVIAMVGIVVETVIEKIERHTTEEWGLSASRRE